MFEGNSKVCWLSRTHDGRVGVLVSNGFVGVLVSNGIVGVSGNVVSRTDSIEFSKDPLSEEAQPLPLFVQSQTPPRARN